MALAKTFLLRIAFLLVFGVCQQVSAQQLASKDVLVLTADDGTMLELTWALTLPTYNAQSVFATVHQGFVGGVSYGVFNLYNRSGSPPGAYRYERIVQYRTQAASGAQFKRPELVWAKDTKQRRRQLLTLTENVFGSGAQHIHTIYELSQGGTVIPIQFKLARSELADQVGQGEVLCGNGSHDFSGFPFRFAYAIDVEDRRPCRPRLGIVSGEYKLEGTTILLAAVSRTAPPEDHR